MSLKTTAPAGEGEGRVVQFRRRAGTDSNGSSAPTPKTNDEWRGQGEWDFVLPWAANEGAKGSITFKPDYDGEGRYFLRSRRIGDPGGGEFLRRLSDAVGASGAWAILDDPLRWLDDLIVNEVAEDPAPLPRAEIRREWRDAALTEPEAIKFLTARGLRKSTVRHFKLMYNRRRGAIGLPVFERDRLVNIRWRYLSPGVRQPKIMGLRGRGSQLYPNVPSGDVMVLGEGELDVLVARQNRIPAVTSTAGTSWNREWNVYITNRRVAVVYDAGAKSMGLARRRADLLIEAGAAEAWAVDLRHTGLKHGEDLTDWFVTYGRSAARLRRLIARQRRSS